MKSSCVRRIEKAYTFGLEFGMQNSAWLFYTENKFKKPDKLREFKKTTDAKIHTKQWRRTKYRLFGDCTKVMKRERWWYLRIREREITQESERTLKAGIILSRRAKIKKQMNGYKVSMQVNTNLNEVIELEEFSSLLGWQNGSQHGTTFSARSAGLFSTSEQTTFSADLFSTTATNNFCCEICWSVFHFCNKMLADH